MQKITFYTVSQGKNVKLGKCSPQYIQFKHKKKSKESKFYDGINYKISFTSSIINEFIRIMIKARKNSIVKMRKFKLD